MKLTKEILMEYFIRLMPTMNYWPDKFVIKKAMYEFEKINGYRFDIYHPSSFAEKILAYTLFYNFEDSEAARAIDKFEAKEYIKEKLGKQDYTIPVYKVWNNLEEIKEDWDALPNSFYLKSTISCNGSNMIRVTDKSAFDKDETIARMRKWFRPRNTRINSYDRSYLRCIPRVIAEEYRHDVGKEDLQDYKFYCFNGEPFIMHTIVRYYDDRDDARIIYDMNWNKLEVSLLDHPRSDYIEKPIHFEEMKEIAKILSKDYPFARIDLYEGENHPIVGEITIGDPVCPFNPLSFDRQLGDKLILPLDKMKELYKKHNSINR